MFKQKNYTIEDMTNFISYVYYKYSIEYIYATYLLTPNFICPSYLMPRYSGVLELFVLDMGILLPLRTHKCIYNDTYFEWCYIISTIWNIGLLCSFNLTSLLFHTTLFPFNQLSRYLLNYMFIFSYLFYDILV